MCLFDRRRRWGLGACLEGQSLVGHWSGWVGYTLCNGDGGGDDGFGGVD